MSHSPAQHIEHAEHAAHASHDNFDKVVTISIAIIAAVLAAVSMLGHKAHSMMLSHQMRAGIINTQASDKWNEYQAYNIRKHAYESLVEGYETLPIVPGTEEKREKAMKRWKESFEKYVKVNLDVTMKQAKKFDADSKHELEMSSKVHHRAERFDLGDLGLQLGVVFCSLAILTKMRLFWFGGIVASIIGFAVAMTGQFDLFMSHDDHGPAHAVEKPNDPGHPPTKH